MSDLADILSFSGLLAQRWQQFTPQMGLAWNPRDTESAGAAAFRWLQYVSVNLFPVSFGGDVEEWVDLRESLDNIFPDVLGFEVDDTSIDDLKGIDRIVFMILVAHEMYNGDASTAIGELTDLGYCITPDSTLTGLETLCRRLDDWLAGGCLPETEMDYWEGCIALMRYYLNDTGSEYLNLSYIQLYSGGYATMSWTPENVATLQEDWGQAKALLEKMDSFRAWYKDNEGYVLSVLLDLNEEIWTKEEESEE